MQQVQNADKRKLKSKFSMTKTIGKASTRTVLEPAEKFLRKFKKTLDKLESLRYNK
jgi:hypothetical protein